MDVLKIEFFKILIFSITENLANRLEQNLELALPIGQNLFLTFVCP